MEMKRYNTNPLSLGKKGEEKLEVLINIEKHEKHENEEITIFVFFVLFDVQKFIWPTQNVLQQ